MSRKKTQPKKNVTPDPKFKSTIIPKLINNIMYDGKRGVAAKIVYEAIEKINICQTKFLMNFMMHMKKKVLQLKKERMCIKWQSQTKHLHISDGKNLWLELIH